LLLVVGALALAFLIGGAWATGLFGATPSASPTPSPTSLADPTATPTQIPSASPSPKPLPTFPVAVVLIDPFTNLVAEPVRDGHSHAGLNFVLLDNGNFWTDYGGIELVRRDIETGDFIDTIALWPEQVAGVQAGFGHLWVLHGHDPTLIERIDPLSGRTVTIDTKADVFDMAVGDAAVYILQNQGQLAEVNPSTNRLGEPYSTDTETDPVYMGFQNGRLALFEEAERRVAIFDPQTRTVIDTWDWSRFGLSSGSRDPSTGIVWVLDRTNQTVTPFDPTTHTFGPSLGVLGVPHQAAFAFGSVWVAAGTYIYRFAPTDHSVQKIIELPEGVYAGSIGIDLQSESVWVSSCYGVACDDR